MLCFTYRFLIVLLQILVASKGHIFSCHSSQVNLVMPSLTNTHHLGCHHCLIPSKGNLSSHRKMTSMTKRSCLALLSSHGGTAFDINFDDNNGGNKKMPKSLQVKVKASNFTREELQAKLDAADQRRKVQSYFSSYY